MWTDRKTEITRQLFASSSLGYNAEITVRTSLALADNRAVGIENYTLRQSTAVGEFVSNVVAVKSGGVACRARLVDVLRADVSVFQLLNAVRNSEVDYFRRSSALVVYYDVYDKLSRSSRESFR